MNCRKANSLLSAYIDSELNGVDQREVRNHLSDCPACEAEHESLLATKRSLARLVAQAPEMDLQVRILDALEYEKAAGYGLSLSRITAWWTLLAESQRARMRALALCTSLSAALVLWLTVPGRMPRENDRIAADYPFRVMQPMPSVAGTQGANGLNPNMPLRGYLMLHHSGEDSRWTNGGPTISPASDVSSGFNSLQP